jgi:hypothetical protein
MAITYSWKVTDIKTQTVNGVPNTIVHANWEKTGIDEDGYSATFKGDTPFLLDGSMGGSFIPYEEINEQNVINWIILSCSGKYGYDIQVNKQIERQIEELRNPVTSVTPPWQTN